MFHDLLGVLLLVDPVIPALHSCGRGVGDVLSVLCPAHFVTFALHQRNEFLPGGSVLHTLVNDVHQSELPTLALRGGAVLSGAHPLLLDLLLRWRKDLQTVGNADFIVGDPVGLQVGGTLVELLAALEAHTDHHPVIVEMLCVHMGGH